MMSGNEIGYVLPDKLEGAAGEKWDEKSTSFGSLEDGTVIQRLKFKLNQLIDRANTESWLAQANTGNRDREARVQIINRIHEILCKEDPVATTLKKLHHVLGNISLQQTFSTEMLKNTYKSYWLGKGADERITAPIAKGSFFAGHGIFCKPHSFETMLADMLKLTHASYSLKTDSLGATIK